MGTLLRPTLKMRLHLLFLLCTFVLLSNAGNARQSRSYNSKGGGGGRGRGGGGRGGGSKIAVGTQCTLVKQQGNRGSGANCFNEQECGQQCSTVNEQQCSTVSEQQCSTVNEQQCSTVNEVVCSVGGGGGSS